MFDDASDPEFRLDFGFGLPAGDLPWREGRIGGWKVSRYPRRIASSYLATTSVDHGGVVLDREGDALMNTGPLECESHAWHVERARGRVVVGGLGLGFFAHVIAAKPDVERVLVCEKDPIVLELFDRFFDRDGFDFWSKVDIVRMDVLGAAFAAEASRRGFARPDYLYMDIWPVYPAFEAPQETACVVRRLQPVEAGWWGQEAAFASWCDMRGRDVDETSFTRYFEDRDVPAVVTAGYIEFNRAVARAHGLCRVEIEDPSDLATISDDVCDLAEGPAHYRPF